VAESRETRCRYCQEVFPEELLRRHGGFCCAEHAAAYEAGAGGDQKKRAEGGCLWCGASLPLLTRLKGERFCSAEHEQQYYRRQAEGILERVKRYRRQGGGSRMRSESVKVTIRPSKYRDAGPAPQDELPVPRFEVLWRESRLTALLRQPEPRWKHEGNLPKSGRLPNRAYWREGLGAGRRAAAPSWQESGPAQALLPDVTVRLIRGQLHRGRLVLEPFEDYHASHGFQAMTDLGRSASWLQSEAVVTPPRWVRVTPALRGTGSFLPERGYEAGKAYCRRAELPASSPESFWQEPRKPTVQPEVAGSFALRPPAVSPPTASGPAFLRPPKAAPPASSPQPRWREADALPKALGSVTATQAASFAAPGPNGSPGLPKSRAILPVTLRSAAWLAAETGPAATAESGGGAQLWAEGKSGQTGETPVWPGLTLGLTSPLPLELKPQLQVSRGEAAVAAVPPIAGYPEGRQEAPELWREPRAAEALPKPWLRGAWLKTASWQPARLGGAAPFGIPRKRVEQQAPTPSTAAAWAEAGEMAQLRQPEVGPLLQRPYVLPYPKPVAGFPREKRAPLQTPAGFASASDPVWIPASRAPQPPAWLPAGSPLEAGRGFWPASGFAVLPLHSLLQNAGQAQKQVYVWSLGLGFTPRLQHAGTKMPARMPFHLTAVPRTPDAGLPAAPQGLWTPAAIQGVVYGPGIAALEAAVHSHWKPAVPGFFASLWQKAAAEGWHPAGSQWSGEAFAPLGAAALDFARAAWTPGFCRQFVIEGGTAAELAKTPTPAPWRAERLRLPHLVCQFPRSGLSSSIGRSSAGAPVFPMPGM